MCQPSSPLRSIASAALSLPPIPVLSQQPVPQMSSEGSTGGHSQRLCGTIALAISCTLRARIATVRRMPGVWLGLMRRAKNP